MIRFFQILFVVLVVSPAQAADYVTPPQQKWGFEGIFGTYDRAAMQRGFQVYKQVCAACHAMDLVSYRNLSALGYNEDEIRAIASEYLIDDGPDEFGEMFQRPGLPSDRFKNPYPNKQAAMAVNNGAYPVDLSLIIQARHYGADYLYALLTGYTDPPEGENLMDGQYWNTYMPGNIISMAPPLMEGMVAYADGTEESVSQYARDLAEFLAWAGDPHMEARKRTGFKAMLFLIVFAGIMYGVKRKVWSELEH